MHSFFQRKTGHGRMSLTRSNSPTSLSHIRWFVSNRMNSTSWRARHSCVSYSSAFLAVRHLDQVSNLLYFEFPSSKIQCIKPDRENVLKKSSFQRKIKFDLFSEFDIDKIQSNPMSTSSLQNSVLRRAVQPTSAICHFDKLANRRARCTASPGETLHIRSFYDMIAP